MGKKEGARQFLRDLNSRLFSEGRGEIISDEEMMAVTQRFHMEETRLFVPLGRDFARVHERLNDWWSWSAGQNFEQQGRAGIAIYSHYTYYALVEQLLNNDMGPQIPIIFLKDRDGWDTRLKTFTPFAVTSVERVDWATTRLSIRNIHQRVDGYWFFSFSPKEDIALTSPTIFELFKYYFVLADRVGLQNTLVDIKHQPKPFWLARR